MSQLKHLLASFFGAVIFYTIIPLAPHINFSLHRIARFCPAVGLLLGIILALADLLFQQLPLSILTRSGLLVILGVGLTGGLHLDGAMDSADGLGVREQERRLAVMQDSHTGAFGVIAAIAIILLKTLALGECESGRWFVLMSVLGWGRWSQVWAIAFYPYLKPTGKGALHRQSFCFPEDLLLGAVILSLFSLVSVYCFGIKAALGWGMVGAGLAIATGCSYYFYRCFGGHTGDTYGAVVEWSETLLLLVAGCF